MKKLTPTYAYLIIYLLGAVVLGILYVYFLMSLSQIKNERIALVNELSADKNTNVIKGIEKVRQYFVISGEEALFVSYLEQECSLFGATCETLSVELSEPNTELASLQMLKIRIRATKDFTSLMQFLQSMEQSRYPITISGAELNQNDMWEGVFTISVPVVPR